MKSPFIVLVIINMAGHGNEVYRVQGLGERRHRSKNIKNKEKHKIGEKGKNGCES